MDGRSAGRTGGARPHERGARLPGPAPRGPLAGRGGTRLGRRGTDLGRGTRLGRGGPPRGHPRGHGPGAEDPGTGGAGGPGAGGSGGARRPRAGGAPGARSPGRDRRPGAGPCPRGPGPEAYEAPEDPGAPDAPGALTPEDARTIASWDRDLASLTTELRRARATTRDVLLPAYLSASQVLRLAADPDGFARELARPLPKPPQPAARRGTRFHAWVESRHEELPLPFLGPEELPGGEEFAGEPEILDERDLDELKEAFARTPYARRTPHRVEVPVHLTLAGRVVRGRIDAVYRDPETGAYEIVDWKTSRTRSADPLQLALYRLAWAEQHGLAPEEVAAAFVYVRTGEVARPARLPGRTELEAILLGGTPPDAG